jgi:aldehyde dehydrogenase (NAD+)
MENGAATLKRVFLELGGKSAKIVLDDVPNFRAGLMGSMVVFHAGQGCAVPDAHAGAEGALRGSGEIAGNGLRRLRQQMGPRSTMPTCIMGPLISKKSARARQSLCRPRQGRKARVCSPAANVRTDKGNGFFIEPTCFVDVRNDMRIAQEEIFGPVLVLIPYDNDDDAMRIANDSEYGFGGAVFGSDLERAMRIAKRIRAGSISVNGGMSITGDLPFGGYKHSGIGREWGMEGIEEFLEVKAIGTRVVA